MEGVCQMAEETRHGGDRTRREVSTADCEMGWERCKEKRMKEVEY